MSSSYKHSVPIRKGMPERLVEIAITKEVREKIKSLKRELTYDQFFQRILKLPDVVKVMK